MDAEEATSRPGLGASAPRGVGFRGGIGRRDLARSSEIQRDPARFSEIQQDPARSSEIFHSW